MKQRLGHHKGISTRACSRCGGDLKERYGRQRYCKSCHAANMRKNRLPYSQLSPESKRKANVRSHAKVALKRGQIKKTNCQVCNSPNVEMHHPDYSKPLEVVFLCRLHHLAVHMQVLHLEVPLYEKNVGNSTIENTEQRRKLKDWFLAHMEKEGITDVPAHTVRQILFEEFQRRGI